MGITGAFAALTPVQRHTFIAALAGWALDAFDFFIMVFCVRAIAHDFGAAISDVAEALFLTLAMRPLGALFFGALAERYGRRPILMINVVSFASLELASAFAPSLSVLLVLRALFGFAMGGEWGVGAALALETLPREGRGLFSGLLQEGYVLGYLLAAALFAFAFEYLGWRGMFAVGVVPAALVFYVRSHVKESPTWQRGGGVSAREKWRTAWRAVREHWGVLLFMVLLMACFNAFSHGTQDLYPTFLQAQHGFDARETGLLAIVYNVGALCGGICFGALSERLGRRGAIATAALLALPMIPWWAYSHSWMMFAVGSFLLQFMVQGAWGVVPAYLNELSPASLRAVLPGFAYQLGNLAMSRISPLQARIAEQHGHNYAAVFAATVAIVGILLAGVALLGREHRDAELNHG